ncbi:alkaline phosphatase [Halostagnicola sp. A-GB9-2]|uniref:alkaline phosphatase n=1 Tax=Halostagnicola sp. A-GB9-2 TaxID=3048066 RepID=UPI0024C07E71|nr:alkaline phosphatase [Halostagnicola sp. A-GB9-2]MDJ1433114.1 alkaline phosphatase [Halostagnicola sp. A-GB9-2]
MSDTSDSSDKTDDRSIVSANRRTFMGAVGAITGASALGGSALANDDGSETELSGGDSRSGDAHNAIVVIPDGAGQAHISGARYLKAWREDPEEFPLNITPDGTSLNVDRAEQIGGMSTQPDDPDQLITDSAAAGTAMATGTKIYSGAISGIGTEENFTPVRTILEAAHDAGMATGLVTTTEITHATPAKFASHVPDRGMGEEIARQYVENATVDVLLGGGKHHFDPEEREDGEDLIACAQEQGYQYVETDDELDSVDSRKVLGLFGSETDRSTHMSYYVDREYVGDTDEPDLVDMTEMAIETLSKCDNGFFLMIESGRVDHQGHAHDNAITHEQLECDEVFGTVLDYVEDPSTPETFAMQVADHETGGMSLGADAYDMDWEAIDNIRASLEYLDDAMDDYQGTDEVAELIEKRTGLELSYGELMDATGGQLTDVLNARTQMGWSSDSHTAEEVPAYAHGPNAEFFGRYFDNTEVSVGIADVLGLEFEPGQEIDYEYQE